MIGMLAFMHINVFTHTHTHIFMHIQKHCTHTHAHRCIHTYTQHTTHTAHHIHTCQSGYGATGSHFKTVDTNKSLFNPNEDKVFETAKIVNITMITGDELIRRSGRDEVYCVKIDTQGQEYNILLGFRQAFEQRRIRYVLLEFAPSMVRTNSGYDPVLIFEFFAKYQCSVMDLNIEPYAFKLQGHQLTEEEQLRPRPTDPRAYVDMFNELNERHNFTYGHWTDLVVWCPANI